MNLYQTIKMRIIKNKTRLELIKYVISGVINTIIGYLIFIIFFRLFHCSPEFSNIADYTITLIVAFILNKKFVFNESKFSKGMLPKFIFAFIVAFSANLLVLRVLHRDFGMMAEIAQIFAMVTYSVLFYLLSKYFVFNK